MLETILASALIAQSVGPGYVGRPTPSFYICLNDPRSHLNLRSKPTTSSRVIGKLRQGNPVDILDRGTGLQDGMWWAYVRTAGGGTGYVRDDYVCVR
jgi:hypothetical protein